MKKYHLILIIVVLIGGLDHLTKWWIDTHFPIGSQMPVWPGFFDIVHWRNTGAAFGFLSDTHDSFRIPFFYISSAAALTFILYYLFKTHLTQRGVLISLSMILGGALGNIIDRILRGSVVDFLFFHWKDAVWTPTLFNRTTLIPLSWPAFNIADAAISIGVVVLLILTVREKA